MSGAGDRRLRADVVVLAAIRVSSARCLLHTTPDDCIFDPSPPPKYPGLHTHRQVLENGDEEHGTSVDFVTDELDGGPVNLQAKVWSLMATTKTT
ncbi:formyltransferase family protein [Shigella flexneri]